MNSREYSNGFKEYMKNGRNVNQSALLVLRDLLVEVRGSLRTIPRNNYPKIALLLEDQNNKWKEICVWLISFQLDREAFSKFIRKVDNKLYRVIVLYGFSHASMDNEYVSKILGKESQKEKKNVRRHRSKAKDSNEGSGLVI